MRGKGKQGFHAVTLWLLAAAILPLWQVVSGREMFFLGDIFHQFYPFQAAVSRLLAEAGRSLPLWNPYSFCGSPLLADPQMQVLYPPAILHRFLPFPLAQGIYSAFHLFFGAAGMAVFLSGAGFGRGAAAAGALAFGFGAHPSMLLATPPILAAFSWLPWAAVFSRRFGASGRAREAVGLGLVLAFVATAGFPQYLLYAAVLAAVIIVSSAFASGVGGKALASGAVLAVLTAFGAAAAAVLPAAAYVLESGRGAALPIQMAAEGALFPLDLAGFLVPLAFMPFEQVRTIAMGNLWCTLHFTGVVSLGLAVTGVVFRRGSAGVRTALLLVLAGVFFGMGPRVPGLGAILAAVPPFSFLRHSGLWMCVADFGLAWLAAAGFEAAGQALNGKKGRTMVGAWALAALLFGVIGGFSRVWEYWFLSHWGEMAATMAARMGMALHPAAVLALACALLWLARRRELELKHAMTALLFLSFGELAMTRVMLQPSVNSDWLMLPAPTESWLGKAAAGRGYFRVLVSPRHQELYVDEGDNLEQVVRNVKASFRYSLPAAAGFREAEGNNPLKPAATERLVNRTKFTKTPWKGEAGAILDDLCVKYIITKTEIRGGEWRKVYDGYADVYENPGARGPVWVVPQTSGRVEAVPGTRPGTWRLSASLSEPGRVVVSESLMKGWKLAGAPAGASIRPYRDALISVKLPAGDFTFDLVYDPWTAKAGAGISFAALAALLAVLGAAWLRR